MNKMYNTCHLMRLKRKFNFLEASSDLDLQQMLTTEY